MESEKVKEIKKALQDHSIEKLKYQDGIKIKEIDFADILTLINELESENDEQYKRIMELEQDLVHADENVFYRECNVTLRENEIKEQALKQFAERLKENFRKNNLESGIWFTNISIVDETLKEFLK